jgi:hypothetical protein
MVAGNESCGWGRYIVAQEKRKSATCPHLIFGDRFWGAALSLIFMRDMKAGTIGPRMLAHP